MINAMPDAMMRAAENYLREVSLNGEHQLPARFNWHDFYRAMVSKAPCRSIYVEGYESGIHDALELISELRKQYSPAAQGRVRFNLHDMDRAFKGGLDLAREDIAKLLGAENGATLAKPTPSPEEGE